MGETVVDMGECAPLGVATGAGHRTIAREDGIEKEPPAEAEACIGDFIAGEVVGGFGPARGAHKADGVGLFVEAGCGG